MSSPQEMYEALPPVTRVWLTVSFVTTAMVSFGTLDGSKLMFYLVGAFLRLFFVAGMLVSNSSILIRNKPTAACVSKARAVASLHDVYILLDFFLSICNQNVRAIKV